MVRYGLRVIGPAVPGFSSAITEREIVEAVYVPAEWADVATWLVETEAEAFGIATVLDARGVPYRYPTRTATAAVVCFPARSDEQPTQQVA